VVTLPVLEALREARPGAEIAILGRPHIASLAVDGGLADSIFDFERAWVSTLFGADPRPPAGAIPCEHCISFVPDPTFARNLRACGAAQVLEGSYQPAEADTVHWADLAMSVLEPMGLARSPAVPHLHPSMRSLELSREAIEDGAVPLVALNPGTGGVRKRWPTQRWVRFVEALATERCRVVILGGPGDHDLLVEIGARLERARPWWLRDLPLPTVAAVLARAAVYAGCDSGITHLAAAVGCRTIALFGPTDPGRFAPRGSDVRVLRDAQAGDVTSLVQRLLAER
jgi:heptosyltransferase-3